MNRTVVLRVRSALHHINLDDLYQKLIDLEYFDSPASRSNHHAYIGGLVDHSIEVMNNLVNYTERLNLIWENERSPYLVGLLHDLCKVDDYTLDKNTFISNPIKRYGEGHGDKSLRIIDSVLGIDLTEEEKNCIYFHMGPFLGKDYWSKYSIACKKYPNILWTHQADIISAYR